MTAPAPLRWMVLLLLGGALGASIVWVVLRLSPQEEAAPAPVAATPKKAKRDWPDVLRPEVSLASFKRRAEQFFPDEAGMRCELPSSFPAVPPIGVVLTVVQAEPPASSILGTGGVVGRDLVVSVPPGKGEGEFDIKGVGRARVWWVEAQGGQWVDCKMVALVTGYSGAFGRVVGAPHSGVRVVGCGGDTVVEADGTFYMDVRTEPCSIEVVAMVDGLVGKGPSVDVQPQQGVDLEVDLAFPEVDAFQLPTEKDIVTLQQRLLLAETTCSRQLPLTRARCETDDVAPLRAALAEATAAHDTGQ